MNLILLGAPGSGKGTQSAQLSSKFNIPHISTGDIFRAAISEGTEMGKKAQEFMNKGELVPDEIVIGIVKERLAQKDTEKGFLLDGFPRTLVQAQELDKVLSQLKKDLTAAIDIEVNPIEIIERLSGRRVCSDCKNVYHTIFEPSENENYCDSCGGLLIQREDDTIETVKKRLEVYAEMTAPLIDYYSKKNILRSVNGQQAVDDVFLDIVTVLKGEYA